MGGRLAPAGFAAFAAFAACFTACFVGFGCTVGCTVVATWLNMLAAIGFACAAARPRTAEKAECGLGCPEEPVEGATTMEGGAKRESICELVLELGVKLLALPPHELQRLLAATVAAATAAAADCTSLFALLAPPPPTLAGAPAVGLLIVLRAAPGRHARCCE